jgi:hypothetical protein
MIQTRRAAKHWSAPAGTNRSETAERQRSTTVAQHGKVGLICGTRRRPWAKFSLVTALICCAPEGTRTPNLLIRSPNQGKSRYAEATLPERTLSVSAVQTEHSSFPLVQAVHRVGQRRGYLARRLQCWNCSVRPRQVPNIRAPSEHRAIPFQLFRPCPGQNPRWQARCTPNLGQASPHSPHGRHRAGSA